MNPLDDHTNIVVHNLEDLLHAEEHAIELNKLKIAQSIKVQLKHKDLSIRKLAEKIGMKHPQIIRITSGENYNIETLIRILEALDLEITIQQKTD